MKSTRSRGAAVLLAAALACARAPIAAADGPERLQVTRVSHLGRDWLVAFSPRPAACAGEFRGYHARAQIGGNRPSELVQMLLLARNLRRPVEVSYLDDGDCRTPAGLLTLLGARP